MAFLDYYEAIRLNQNRSGILKEFHEWFQNFICRPHGELGRSGDVCPYAAPALERKHILLTYYELQNDNGIDKRKVLAGYLLKISDEFKNCTSNEEGSLDCLIVIIEGLSMYEWRYVMDGSYRDVKPQILQKKLMVGCFYPFYNRPSLRNPNFFPMRPPIPVFAFRHMVRFDKASLKESNLYIKIYESFYPPKRNSLHSAN